MTTLTDDDIRSLAVLSAISVTDEEVENLRGDLSNILDYVKQLDELDTDGVAPTYQVTGLANVSREDEIVDAGVTREQLIALAPEEKEHQIKVPKVL